MVFNLIPTCNFCFQACQLAPAIHCNPNPDAPGNVEDSIVVDHLDRTQMDIIETIQVLP